MKPFHLIVACLAILVAGCHPHQTQHPVRAHARNPYPNPLHTPWYSPSPHPKHMLSMRDEPRPNLMLNLLESAMRQAVSKGLTFVPSSGKIIDTGFNVNLLDDERTQTPQYILNYLEILQKPDKFGRTHDDLRSSDNPSVQISEGTAADSAAVLFLS